MVSKAERTSKFIIKTVAPLFNKHGYEGTSLSDLTKATGLTKGAIYGNFENKQALALSSFEYLRNLVLEKFDELLGVPGNAIDKLSSFIRFYRQYDVFTLPLGGCPILNTSIDAQNNNKTLTAACKETIREIEGKLAEVLETGRNNGEIRLPVTPLQFAKQFYTIIQGAVAMASATRDRKYLVNTVNYLEHLMRQELLK